MQPVWAQHSVRVRRSLNLWEQSPPTAHLICRESRVRPINAEKGPRILRSFYTCTVESILTGCITAWFGNSTAGNRRALQRVVRTARHIVGGELPSLQDIYTRRCTRKAWRIIKDSSHPSHRLLSLLPSGRRFRSIRSRTSRLRDSYVYWVYVCVFCTLSSVQSVNMYCPYVNCCCFFALSGAL